MKIQISLRNLLALIGLIAIAIVIVQFYVTTFAQEWILSERFEKCGVVVSFASANSGATVMPNFQSSEFDADTMSKLLDKVDQLEHLILLETPISDEELQKVLSVSLPDLRNLVLNSTVVSDKGIAGIDNLSGLTHLHLENTRITDESVFEIVKLKSLQELYVKGTEISAEGCESIQNRLPRLKIFR